MVYYRLWMNLWQEGLSYSMYINNQLYKTLLSCPWLEKCGVPQENIFSSPVIWIQKVGDVTKNITSIRWENACLEEQGNISEFLAKNYKAEYNHSWNAIVKTIKTDYLPNIMPLIEDACQKNELPKDILNDVRFNLLSIFLASYFSQYYQSEFFEGLLDIYLSGHIPCGWRGKYPDGCIMVF